MDFTYLPYSASRTIVRRDVVSWEDILHYRDFFVDLYEGMEPGEEIIVADTDSFRRYGVNALQRACVELERRKITVHGISDFIDRFYTADCSGSAFTLRRNEIQSAAETLDTYIAEFSFCWN